MLAMAGGGLLLLLIIVLGVTQCSDDEEEAPAAAGGAASVEHQLLYEGAPDAYLMKPGKIKVENTWLHRTQQKSGQISHSYCPVCLEISLREMKREIAVANCLQPVTS